MYKMDERQNQKEKTTNYTLFVLHNYAEECIIIRMSSFKWNPWLTIASYEHILRIKLCTASIILSTFNRTNYSNREHTIFIRKDENHTCGVLVLITENNFITNIRHSLNGVYARGKVRGLLTDSHQIVSIFLQNT
jgi:hypothetical protein